MFTSLGWRRIAATGLFFDESQAAEYQQAVAELHGLQSPWPGQGEQQVDPKVEAQRELAQQRLKQSQQHLARARRLRESGGTVIRACGITLAILGLCLFFYRAT